MNKSEIYHVLKSIPISLQHDATPPSPAGHHSEEAGMLDPSSKIFPCTDKEGKHHPKNQLHRELQSSGHHPAVPSVSYPRQRMLRTHGCTEFSAQTSQPRTKMCKRSPKSSQQLN